MTARDELQQWVDDIDRLYAEEGLSDATHEMMHVDLARQVLAEMDEQTGQAELDVYAATHGQELIRGQAIQWRNERDAAHATLDAVRAHRRFHYTYADDVQVVVASELDALLDRGQA